MEYKRFKDPIYGYVEIDENLIVQVIDTAVFQRLRDVIQTSYAPLYSSAVHNRFVHSLGVYHLGRIASKAFLSSLKDEWISVFPQYIKIFELACLLHDVGHAPFSHTGEKFYLDIGERTSLHNRIVELTNDIELEKEILTNAYKAAPHELMSVIVALQSFEGIIPVEMRSFFARCITGYKYVNSVNPEKSLMNCLIELINSKIIDVDKLDYLLRDSYMTGFDTITIDYMRLLRSVCVIPDKNGYYKKVMHQILKREVLSDEFLSEGGVEIENYGKVRLIGDSDIHYLMKNLGSCIYVDEYYNRNIRRHPIWKTEAEFQAIFLGHEKELAVIEEEFGRLRNSLRTQGIPFIINPAILGMCESEVETIRKLVDKTEGLMQEKNKAALEVKSRHVRLMQILKEFAEMESIDFDFQIIYTNQFNSGFRKQEFGNIELVFPELKNPCRFGEVSAVLTSQKSKGEKFFYIYYKRREPKQKVRINGLIMQMLMFAGQIKLEQSISERLI